MKEIIFRKKPAPDSALEIAELMNLNPDEIIYIGDSKTDILTGHNAGMGRQEFYGGSEIEKNLKKIMPTIFSLLLMKF